MRRHYDFSGAVRGKYAGRVDTADIRRLDSAVPAQKNGEGSCRDIDGEIRHKRGETLIGTLRKTYGPNFAPGIPGDTRLDTLRKRAGGKSLANLLNK